MRQLVVSFQKVVQVLLRIFETSELGFVLRISYSANEANCWNAGSPGVSCPFRIMFATSIAAKLEAADAKVLKPSIDLVWRLMKRWSCSTILFKYFRRSISIETGQPKRFSIWLTA